jgi:hypothetical protein
MIPTEIVFEVEQARPLIPDGVYLAVCVGCDIKQVFTTLKASFRFKIADGPHQGIELFCPFRVGGKILPGSGPGSGPRPRIRRGSNLYAILCRVLILAKNAKAHRISHKELIGKLCRIQTRTVTRDYRGRELRDHYSVVADVLNVEAG